MDGGQRKGFTFSLPSALTWERGCPPEKNSSRALEKRRESGQMGEWIRVQVGVRFNHKASLRPTLDLHS